MRSRTPHTGGSRLLGTALLLVIWMAAGSAPAADPVTAAQRIGHDWQAEYVGAETCLGCHDDVGEAYHGSPHHPRHGAVVPGSDIESCESCHGPGEQHMETGSDIIGVETMRALDADTRTWLCLQCHARQRDTWFLAEHAEEGVDCASCHVDQVHWAMPDRRGPRDFPVAGEFCLQCHPEVTRDFRLSYRHPVLEGMMACTDCHAPHGETAREALLVTENAPCLRCHTEVAGPFVFEHAATVDEECTTCHRPHGSPNRMLLTQDSNSLCVHCHWQPGFPVIGDVDHGPFLRQRALCYDCHVEIHGSNAHEYYLRP
ncbi:MAG: cytochrome c3 family protein [Candidatus Krumholzibacteriia bacterium]